MVELFGHLRDTHNALLEGFENELAEVELDWQHEYPGVGLENEDAVYAFYRLKETLQSSSGAFLRHFEESGEYSITEGNFDEESKNVCEAASNSEAKEYAISLCQAMIEVAFYASIYGESELQRWTWSIGKVMDEGDPVVVEKAFERILSYEYRDVDERPIVSTENMDEVREKFYHNQVWSPNQSSLNTEVQFPEVIEELRDVARSRKERLA
ncbi:MAG: hypothetical protein ABEI58_01415 [Candidatus Nanohaloarchaea archaeon]